MCRARCVSFEFFEPGDARLHEWSVSKRRMSAAQILRDGANDLCVEQLLQLLSHVRP
jgi:hypothetical protein